MGIMKNNVFVIGHKNPDTDSICSAIAYANLKNKLYGGGYAPKRAGQVNAETEYVLQKFGVETPEYIADVGAQVKDVDIRTSEGVPGSYSLKRAYNIIREHKLVSLAVVDEDNILEGIITIGDIATSDMDVYDNRILSKAKTQYKNIVETLDGEMAVGDENSYFDEGKVLIAAGNPDILEGYVEPKDMVILGNRYESQFCAIEMNAGCIIVCMGAPVSITIRKLAAEKGCTIITTPHDTYTVARLINQSMPISYFMTGKNLITFKTDDFIDDIRSVMVNKRHRHFPIVDVYGRYCGMISRRSLLDMEKKRIILVDHNEKTQAVDGIEGAEILEIIDHHRLGNLETVSPVFFRNQPLGCTATIVSQMYQENNVEIDAKTAGLLCAAIISDTLMFRSPTCTAVDKRAAEDLAAIAGIDIETFAEEMFGAGSNLKEKTTEEIFYQDFKKFSSNGIAFGVGQISSLNAAELEAIKERLMEYMEKTVNELGVDMLLFMLTNIITESTDLLFKGSKAREIVSNAYGVEPEEGSVMLEGVVSRKKQLVPKIIAGIQQ